MKLGDLTADVLRRAVKIYAREVYGSAWPEQVERALKIPGRNFVELLFGMIDESGESGETEAHHRRFVLRLGNPNYPCMKLVLEEVLFDGEFFFSVDTHDEIDLDPSFPGYDDWQELCRYNREVKRRVEEAFAREGIPSIQTMRDIAAEDASTATPAPSGRKVLLALDNPLESEAVALALRSRGYEVTEAPRDPGRPPPGGSHPSGGAGYVAEPLRFPEIASAAGVDLVLVGHVFGGESGRRLCCELAEHRKRVPGRPRGEKRRLPCIVLGVRASDRRERPEGVDAEVPEPFDREELLRALDELLS